MKIKLPSYVKVFVKLAITVAALWYVFSRLELQEVLGTIAQSKFLYLAGALILFVLSKMVSSLRLNKFLVSTGIHISERANMKLYLQGMYYNLFLPGGIGGDGYKIYLLNRKYEVRTRKIFWAVMMDRIIGVVALFCMAVVLFCFIPGMGKYAWYIWILIPIAISISYLAFRRFFPYLLRVFRISNLLSIVVQLLQLCSALLILLSLKVPGSLEGYLFVFLISSMVAVLPLTIGGIGSREFTFMLGAQWLGLDLNLSIALSLLFYLITAFSSFWGIIYSIGPGIKLEE
ncbi:MAG: flippase-like domain-containing protein [Bacteroidetes bacterium]|nr:flippase-like domain-containing protein [Bacteroidota bacterium]